MADIDGAFDYIAADSPRAAETVIERIVQALEGLPDMPHRGRLGRVPGTRELIIPRTSYIAVYEIIDQWVSVTRVVHSHQDWPPK